MAGRRHKDAKGQGKIDFSWGDKQWSFRVLRLRPFIAKDGKPVSPAAQKNVLKAIDGYAGRDGWCFATLDTIAADMQQGRRVVIRAIEALIAQLVLNHRVSPKNRGRVEYQVCWDNVIPPTRKAQREAEEANRLEEEARAKGKRPRRPHPSHPEVVPPKRAGSATKQARQCHHDDVSSNSGEDSMPESVNQEKNHHPLTPAKVLDAARANQRIEPTYGAVVAEMIDMGVQHPTPAIDAAKDRFVDETLAFRLMIERCRWFRRNFRERGYGPAALQSGIAATAPGLPETYGWPPAKNPAPQAPAAPHKGSESTDDRMARMEREAIQSDRDGRYGARLAAMTPGEIEELAKGLSSWERKRLEQIGADSVGGRAILLRELAKQESSQPVEIL